MTHGPWSLGGGTMNSFGSHVDRAPETTGLKNRGIEPSRGGGVRSETKVKWRRFYGGTEGWMSSTGT